MSEHPSTPLVCVGRLTLNGRDLAESDPGQMIGTVMEDGSIRIGATPDDSQRAAMTIREGLRMVLKGWEELWNLPRSFETKKEQGRR